MRIRMLFIGIAAAACALGAGCEKSTDGTGTQAVAGRCEHQIKPEKCPFCTPSLIESEGFCGEHAVAEALCATCRPYLKAAFRAQGDWCDEHAVPESQCLTCNPELKEQIRPGVHAGAIPEGLPGSTAHDHDHADADAETCEHTIVASRCPFCTPSLIESEGFCGGHGVAEALCVKCRPYLEAAFKAEGDWCTAHATPESQCAACNPELNTDTDEQG